MRGLGSFSKGFTLIEMVMILVIIGILVAIVIPKYSTQMDAAKEVQTKSNLRYLHSAIMIYMKENDGAYPPELAALGLPSGIPPNDHPAILAQVPLTDGWGTPFQYDSTHGAVNCKLGEPNSKCDVRWGDQESP